MDKEWRAATEEFNKQWEIARKQASSANKLKVAGLLLLLTRARPAAPASQSHSTVGGPFPGRAAPVASSRFRRATTIGGNPYG
jgi:hypothetical protein